MSIDQQIEENFKSWSMDIPENIYEENNKILQILFFNLKIKGGFYNKINHNLFMKQLNYSLEDKIEIYVNYSSQQLLAKVFFDRFNGGRVGLTHGGCLFFSLFLCIYILHFEIISSNDDYLNFKSLETIYKIKVPVNNFIIIRAFLHEEKNEIEAEMLNSQNRICVTTICKYLNIKNCVKF